MNKEKILSIAMGVILGGIVLGLTVGSIYEFVQLKKNVSKNTVDIATVVNYLNSQVTKK